MRKLTISVEIEVDEDIVDPEMLPDRTLQLLFCDAFAEFCFARKRGNEEAYVEERYPSPGYDWIDKKEKVASTKLRNHLAEAIRQGAAGGDFRTEKGKGA